MSWAWRDPQFGAEEPQKALDERPQGPPLRTTGDQPGPLAPWGVGGPGAKSQTHSCRERLQ